MSKSIKTTGDASPRSGPSPRSANDGHATKIEQHKASGVLSKRKTTTFHLMLLLLCLCASRSIHSQTITPNTFSLSNLFCTGLNSALSGCETIGNSDPYWSVSCSSCGFNGYSAAVVTNPPSGCSWNTAGCSWPYYQWITSPNMGCSGGSTSYNCINTPDLYFKRTISLTSPIFLVALQIKAAGWVEDISVNGTIVYQAPGANGVHPMDLNIGINVQICRGWQTGLNELIIHVKNDPSYVTSGCKHTGLQVRSWPAPACAYAAISGPTMVCAFTNNVFCMNIPTSAGCTGPVPLSYWWNMPAFPPPPAPQTPTNVSWPSYTTSTKCVNASVGYPGGTITAISGYSVTSGVGSPYPNGYKGVKNEVCLSVGGFVVQVQPTLGVNPTGTTICSGQSAALTATGASGTFSWYAPPTNSLVGTGSPFNVSPLSTTMYTVKSTVSPCTYSRTVKVTVNPLPGVSIWIPSGTTTICSGQGIWLGATGSANKFTWYPPPTGQVSSGTVFYPTSSTTYTVVGSFNSLNTCTNSATQLITVNPKPALVASASPSAICPGGTSQLSATGATTINWQPVGLNGNPLTVSPGSTTTYTAYSTSTAGCIGQSVTKVAVLSVPTISVTPPLICTGVTNTLTGGGAASYTWYIGGSSPSTINSQPTITVNLSSVTTITCIGSSPSTCTASTVVILNPGSSSGLSVSNVTICTNSASCAALTVTSSATAPVSFTWSPAPSAVSSGTNASTATVCPGSTTIYSISASGTTVCPMTTTVSVTTLSNCCPQSTANYVPLSTTLAGTYSNTSYMLTQDAMLTGPTYFALSEVIVAPGVKLVIPSGTSLDLDKTHFYACGATMWKGIEVQDGGQITTQAANTRTASSFIEDAEVAIDLSNISAATASGPPPIDIQRVIFNKNFIGISIENVDPALDSLALGINGCVFTSRTLTFTTHPAALTWPNATPTATLNGLRVPASGTPTTGLVAPYPFTGFPSSFLNAPYNSQVGHIGVRINSFVPTNSVLPTPGVQWGITYTASITNDFNLFDNIGNGIDVTNAGLTTINNRFQNMQQYFYPPASSVFGGNGINHTIDTYTLLNARLKSDATNGVDNGSYFWDCYTGINATNVYEFWLRGAIFRSNHGVSTANNPIGTTPGDYGINYESNRFHFYVVESQFNNLRTGISFNTPQITQNFDMTGSGPVPGIYARACHIEYNYFGPLPTSTTAYTGNAPNMNEYMSDAIVLNTPNPNNWMNASSYSSPIVSNRIDRCFRGITINNMWDMPLAVEANSLLIEDDFTYGGPAFGYGISAVNNQGNLSISDNTLQAIQPGQPPTNNVALIYCETNMAPVVSCNRVSQSMYGFQFEGLNAGTVWYDNLMCDNYAGLVLSNNGEIGQQGSSAGGCGDAWSLICNAWGAPASPAVWQTLCINSNANNSPLFVVNNPAYLPSQNWSTFGGTAYSTFPPAMPSLDTSPGANSTSGDCILQYNYLPVPSWRSATPITGLASVQAGSLSRVSLRPNPSNGRITIGGVIGLDEVSLKVTDVSGRTQYQSQLQVKENGEAEIDLQHLNNGVYLVEIKGRQNQMLRKKLVINK